MMDNQRSAYNARRREYYKQYMRKHALKQGKCTSVYGLNKRNYPENGCELCGGKWKLDYHHWADLNVGLWVCRFCHQFAEQSDKGISQELYFRLKKMAEKEGSPTTSCPECGNRLFYRVKIKDYVCVNLGCSNQWKGVNH